MAPIDPEWKDRLKAANTQVAAINRMVDEVQAIVLVHQVGEAYVADREQVTQTAAEFLEPIAAIVGLIEEVSNTKKVPLNLSVLLIAEYFRRKGVTFNAERT